MCTVESRVENNQMDKRANRQKQRENFFKVEFQINNNKPFNETELPCVSIR